MSFLEKYSFLVTVVITVCLSAMILLCCCVCTLKRKVVSSMEQHLYSQADDVVAIFLFKVSYQVFYLSFLVSCI